MAAYATDSTSATTAVFQGALPPSLVCCNALQSINPKTPYSARCAALRIKKCAFATASGEILGISQRRKGSIKRDVLAADPTSVDNKKVKLIHTSTGSQYLRNRRIGGGSCRSLVRVELVCLQRFLDKLKLETMCIPGQAR